MSSEIPRHAIAWLLWLALGVAGCGQPKGVVFEPPTDPILWPPAPRQARIEYIGQLVTDRDLKPSRSFLDDLFGEHPARSMLSPYSVCTDGADRLFVCDSNAQTVHVFDLESRRYERWPAADAGLSFAQPLGVAWDETHRRLLVSDGAGGRVHVLDTEGRPLGSLGPELQRPCGIAIDETIGRVYVADVAAHQVVVLDHEGTVVSRIGERGADPGRFNFPTNVAVDASGHLYVSDSLNFRVQVFDPDLAFQRVVGSLGDMPGYFSQPKGIALDSENHLYVVDAHFESVQAFDDEGRLLLAFGREGHGPGEFWLPAGIHIDSSDRIWIADSYNRRVQVFQYLSESAP